MFVDDPVAVKERSKDGVTNLNRKCWQQVPCSNELKKPLFGVILDGGTNRSRRLVFSRLGLGLELLVLGSGTDALPLEEGNCVLTAPDSKIRIINLLSSRP